jgi:Tfp pilus assembly protein PilV
MIDKLSIQKSIRHRGLALVETAIVIILLLMLTVGMIGFGIFFVRTQQITSAARQGARLACVNGADIAGVAASIDSYLDSRNISHEFTVIGPDPDVSNSIKATVKGTNLDILQLGSIPLFGINPFPDTFTASVTMAKEGP